jgi:2-polyprenyl-3-methyl-5-hydroxy-6-metoxy-1,4-benzoquinol methylase
VSIDPLSDDKIIDSWHRNVSPWTDAVREQRIESRKLVTNQAILDAVLSRSPSTMLDIGCGEGWLARAVSAHGVQVTGVDVVPALIDQASKAGGGTFLVASHEQLALGALQLAVDVAVANFSMIGKDSVVGVVRRAPDLLTSGGALIIQTMHPLMANGDEPYVDGWRPGSWTGFSADFVDPAPWYFRTMETWISLIAGSGLRLCEVREPLHPATRKPASVIFIAERSPRT